MPKNIVICADGTGNSTIKGRGTNVFKLYESVDENGHRFDPACTEQVAIYHDGVGTESNKILRLFGGAMGWGLSRNVRQLYGELARVYRPGDRIYLFGFSRGAFTVRTLAGLVVTCGILDLDKYPTNRAFDQAVRTAYGEYRRKYQTHLSRWLRGPITLDKDALRKRFSVPIPAFTDSTQKIIHFIGVWDTVDAVGLPFKAADLINEVFYRFKFPDTTLSNQVGSACQALAVDEERQSFTPVLWEETPADIQRITQVWFAGVHSNVGGGYPRQGMSLVALDWMMTMAEAAGLRFLAAERQLYRDGADVDDKKYDPRAMLGVFYRRKPRNIQALSDANRVAPKVHRTVYQRIARNTEGYAPGALPPDSEVVSTSAPTAVTDRLRQLVAAHHGTGGPLVRREWRALRLGVGLYWVFVAATLAMAGLTIRSYAAGVGSAADWRATLLVLAQTIFSTEWLGVAARTVWHHPGLAGLAVVALLMMLWVDHRVDDTYSEFWHRLRVRLREVLEAARAVT